MTVVDAAAVAEGAVLVKVVQTAIDVVVLGPLTSRWSKAGRAAVSYTHLTLPTN